MVLTLYKKDTSAPCRSVYMILEALNIKDVEYITLNLQQKDHFKDEYLKINPQHTIPTLKDGDFIIWDSHAVTTYLINKYAKDDSLYPKDPQKRAIIDQRLHFDGCILFSSLREAMVPVLYEGETSVKPENLAKMKSGYDFMEKFFSGPWLTGEQFTLADICCGATISSMNEVLPIDAKTYPKLTAWYKRFSSLDICVKANKPGLEAFREMVKNAIKA